MTDRSRNGVEGALLGIAHAGEPRVAVVVHDEDVDVEMSLVVGSAVRVEAWRLVAADVTAVASGTQRPMGR